MYFKTKKLILAADSKIIAGHVISSSLVKSLSDCIKQCIKEILCQAFSLDKDMKCIVGSSSEEEDATGAAGAKYYSLV